SQCRSFPPPIAPSHTSITYRGITHGVVIVQKGRRQYLAARPSVSARHGAQHTAYRPATAHRREYFRPRSLQHRDGAALQHGEKSAGIRAFDIYWIPHGFF